MCVTFYSNRLMCITFHISLMWPTEGDTPDDPDSASPWQAPPRPPGTLRQPLNQSQISRLTTQLLSELQTNEQVTISEFIAASKCDRRQISEIVAVLSVLDIVTVLRGKIISLNARERFVQPINLAKIRDSIREASQQLQTLQIQE
jgi:hypothetical protein